MCDKRTRHRFAAYKLYFNNKYVCKMCMWSGVCDAVRWLSYDNNNGVYNLHNIIAITILRAGDYGTKDCDIHKYFAPLARAYSRTCNSIVWQRHLALSVARIGLYICVCVWVSLCINIVCVASYVHRCVQQSSYSNIYVQLKLSTIASAAYTLLTVYSYSVAHLLGDNIAQLCQMKTKGEEMEGEQPSD